MILKQLRVALGLFLALMAAPAPAPACAQIAGEFEIRFNLDTTGLTTLQQNVVELRFQQATDFWEDVIVGYQPGVSLAGIDIDVDLSLQDGPGGVLAFAGPTGNLFQQAGFTFQGGTTAGGLAVSQGAITVDIADFANSSLDSIISHEIGHALGFGLLFEENNLIVPSPGLGTPGQYLGVNGLATFRQEFNQPGALFVPLEDAGGPGTANAHLDENVITDAAGNVTGFGAPTGITDQFGRDLSDELLTGFIGPTPGGVFLSNTSAAIFEDLGFQVVLPNPVAVPEPSSTCILLAMGLCISLRRRRDRFCPQRQA